MRRILAVVGLAVAIMLVLAIIGTGLVVSRFGVMPEMMRGFGFRTFGFGGGFGLAWLVLLVRLIVWGIIIAGVVLVVAWLANMMRRPVAATSSRETPLDILRLRYAKGEITKEQYDQLRQDLSS